MREQMQALKRSEQTAAGRAGSTDLADRSGRPFDGNQRPRHRHRGLQRADRGGCTKHHLIVAHEVTNVGHDRDALARWPRSLAGHRARDLIALADRGYFDGEEILQCERAGIAAGPRAAYLQQHGRGALRSSVTSSTTPNAMSTDARPGRTPSGGSRRRERQDAAQVLAFGLSEVPDQGAVHDQRLPTHHALGARAGARDDAARLDGTPEAARLRRQTVEHLFGTLKAGWAPPTSSPRRCRGSEQR